MENDILDSLNDIGYQGPLTDEVAFAKALDGGPKSLEFTKLIHILADELRTLCGLEESVHLISSTDESSSFLLELSSFLKELKCPYKCLITGHMSSRLQSKEDRLLLLDYMLSELMAARMVQVDHPKEKSSTGMDIIMHESPTAKDLKEILISLKFNKPPPNITVEMLFSKLEAKLKETIQKEGDKLVGKPLYNKALADNDWKQLEISFAELYEEYRLRRETLITRLECTIQSFEWSDRLKSKKDLIQSVYRPKRDALKLNPSVKLSDFLAARTSLLQVEKTSSASVRKNTQSDVNKVIIGQVPDRGGRPNEQQPPPPEMPSWQQRTSNKLQDGVQVGRGGGGMRGRGRGGSDTNRGGFDGNRGRSDTNRGGFDGNRGGFDGNRGSFDGNCGGFNGNRGGFDGNRGGFDGNRGGFDGDRGGFDGNRGGFNNSRGGFDGVRGDRGDRGRGGRVQGGYNTGQDRPQTSPAPYGRNYQTYEVPPGGYQNNGHDDRRGSFDNRSVDSNRSFNSSRGGYQGYDSSGGYNQGGGNKGYHRNQGYQTEGYSHGYQNEHDDRTSYQGRGRGGYRGRR